MAKETIQIADKPTLDRILEFLLGDEAGLAVLKSLLIESADKAESTTDDLKEVNRAVDTISGYLTSNTYGLNAIKTAISGRANESTSTAIKGLLENGTYGLNALKNAITGRANETTVNAVKALLENGNYGLNALKTAISNSKKFSNTTAGVLQINSKVSEIGTDTVKRTILAAYSPEINISGNGQIVFYDTNKFNPTTVSIAKLVDVVIDGCAVPIAKTSDNIDSFTLYKNGATEPLYIPRKVEFGNSFKCKLGFFGAISSGYSTDITCTAEANYFVQLR